jgi:hypothetical protein
MSVDFPFVRGKYKQKSMYMVMYVRKWKVAVVFVLHYTYTHSICIYIQYSVPLSYTPISSCMEERGKCREGLYFPPQIDKYWFFSVTCLHS